MKQVTRLLWLLCLCGFRISALPPEYAVEEVTDPPTPHGTNQIDGMDFLPDGRMAVCLPSGEIYFYEPATKAWQLFAEGLHNPLGLVAVSNSELVVVQRPELTRVSDTDGDGRADFFEVLTDQFGMSGNYHEFAFTPVRDKAGNFYFSLGTGSSGNGIRAIVRGRFDERGRPGRMHASTPYRGWVMQYTTDGKTVPFSSGHRTPNGLGFDLKGNLFVTDNQGDWVGSSKLFHIKQGRFYGHAASQTWRREFEGVPVQTPVKDLDAQRTRAAVVFPHGSMANSPTQVLAISEKAKFGPFTGQLLVGEMNRARIMRVMLEEVGGELQGACVPFIDGAPLRNGCNRMAWAPDGSLYVGHSKHTWAGNQGIQRVVYSGKTPFEVAKMTLTKTGFSFVFTRPVDPASVTAEAFGFSRYYYEYHQAYGAKQSDKTEVPVADIRVAKGGRQVEVDLRGLRAWHIHEVKLDGLKASDGQALANSNLAYTLNRLLNDTPPPPVQYGGAATRKPKPPAKKAPPAPVFGSAHEAENATLAGVSYQGQNRGFTGSGYADFGAAADSHVQWGVVAEKAGAYRLHIRYANGASSRPLRLLVNGQDNGVLPFGSTDSWTLWKDESATVKLKQGVNTIRVQATGDSGGNIDHLRFEPVK